MKSMKRMRFIVVGCPPRLVRVREDVFVKVCRSQKAVPDYGTVAVRFGFLDASGCSQKRAMIPEETSVAKRGRGT